MPTQAMDQSDFITWFLWKDRKEISILTWIRNIYNIFSTQAYISENNFQLVNNVISF